MSSAKDILMQDLRDVESYLEREADPYHREDPVTFGILRILYHILTIMIRREERRM